MFYDSYADKGFVCVFLISLFYASPSQNSSEDEKFVCSFVLVMNLWIVMLLGRVINRPPLMNILLDVTQE